MVEYWDIYDKNRNIKEKKVKRGDKLNDDEYHLVVNAWIKNSKNEFLITQRSPNKSHPLMWECTGGSAVMGESSIEAAKREVKEELGIDVDITTGKFIGTTLRYYPNCPDILDVWLFESEVDIKDVVIQQEEVNDVMWASVETIKKLYDDNKFEANAYFEEVLTYLNEEVYYIGFNANNAICNDTFFKGSITLYPTNERGNIYFSSKVLTDTKSDKFMNEYKIYIYSTAKKIQNLNKNAKFICFNEKIRKLCSDMDDLNIIKSNDSKLLDFLNNKFDTREKFKKIVPTFDRYIIDNSQLSFKSLKENFNCDKFVVQCEVGSGGDSTYLVTKEEDLNNIKIDNKRYCISKYINHLPLNVTMIISDDDILILPISVQLIKQCNNKFKYFGGDFIHTKRLSDNVKNMINKYSKRIGNEIKKMGYRGVLGIDYILCDNEVIYYMEINPRFQSSSFLISLSLNEKYNTNIGELHFMALTGKKIDKNIKLSIDFSFVDCNSINNFDNLDDFNIINNGYFKDNLTSNYRKIFNRSILSEDSFEKLERSEIDG